MSDHLIAEANRHAMTLPTTHPTHADIAWYVREVDQLSAKVKSLREWQQEVIQNAWAHKATVETAIARAERAEVELAKEREKVRVLREAWLCGHTDGIDCGSGQRIETDFVTLDESEAKAHAAKYIGSWTTEGWYRAIAVKAPVALDAAMKKGAK